MEVDDIPDGGQVISLDIEVLKIERMLPDINTDNRNVGQKRILVGCGGNLKSFGRGVVSEPAPSRALDSGSGSVELLLHVLDRAKRLHDGLLQGTVTQSTTVALLRRRGGGEVLPEKRVVNVASTVETESCLEGDALLGCRCFGICRFGCIERIDVGLVVLRVMELHDLLRDVGLKGIVSIGERGKSVGHVDDDKLVVGKKEGERAAYLPAGML